jgi:ATP-dependent RNA helicase DDX3X
MSESNFDMGDVASALSATKPEVVYEGRPKDLEDAKQKARQHGYKERVEYEYTERGDTRKVAKFARCDYTATGELGITAPRNPDLEAELFSDEKTYGKGMHIDILENVKIEVTGENVPKQEDSVSLTSFNLLVFVTDTPQFDKMPLHPVLQETLKMMHYLEPTAIQKIVIPAVMELRDMVVSAQTGSGKTFAYLCPVISHLMGRAHQVCAPKWNPARYNPQVEMFRAEPLVLIVLPTRELAWQVFDECRRLSYRSGLRPCLVYGGGPMSDQREELLKGCDILIATPGRLKDFLRNPRVLSLHRTR